MPSAQNRLWASGPEVGGVVTARARRDLWASGPEVGSPQRLAGLS